MNLVPSLPSGHSLSEKEEKLFRELFIKKHGYDPIHVHVSSNHWVISRWKTEDVAWINELGRSAADHPNKEDDRQFNALQKLWEEIASTDRHTVPLPQSIPIVKLNVLTKGGMTEMGKRSTGESSTTWAFTNIGTGTTGEDQNDDVIYSNSLQTQQARKATGSKKTVNQQERYSCAFDDADVTGEPLNITEAGLNTASPSGIQGMRVTFPAQTLDVGFTIAFQAFVNHRNGTAS